MDFGAGLIVFISIIGIPRLPFACEDAYTSMKKGKMGDQQA